MQQKSLKNYIHINLRLQRTTKNSFSRAEFDLTSLGFLVSLNLVFHISDKTQISHTFSTFIYKKKTKTSVMRYFVCGVWHIVRRILSTRTKVTVKQVIGYRNNKIY